MSFALEETLTFRDNERQEKVVIVSAAAGTSPCKGVYRFQLLGRHTQAGEPCSDSLGNQTQNFSGLLINSLFWSGQFESMIPVAKNVCNWDVSGIDNQVAGFSLKKGKPIKLTSNLHH